jgi:uncharacterized membrane protein
LTEAGQPPAAALPRAAEWIALAVLVLGFAALFAFLSLERHLAFQSHAFDLGNMDQAAWNTAHGNMLGFTDMDVHGRVLTSRLAIHVEPLLVPLSFLYWLHSGPETLLTIQAVVVALGAIPVYLLARRLLDGSVLAFAFSIAYLLHPSLQNAVLDDFHPVTLSACFLAWTLYFLHTRQLLWYAVFAVLAASSKEEVGLLIAALGIWLWVRGNRVAAAASVVGGTGWFLVCIGIIIPHYNFTGQSPYLDRYAYLGHGIGGILQGVITHPGRLGAALSSSSRHAYLLFLVHPVGLLSLLGAPVLLLTAPVFVINLLSTDPHTYSGYYQYSAELVPVVVISAAYGVRWLRRYATRFQAFRPRLLAVTACVFLLAASVWDCHRWGFTPVSKDFAVPSSGSHQAIENRILSRIPSNAVVAAADEIEPHLSDRRWAYLLPTVHPRNGPPAQYIVLDASIPSSPVTPVELWRTYAKALQQGYRFAHVRDGVMLLKREPGTVLSNANWCGCFYDFTEARPSHMISLHVHWGPLELLGFVLHPRSDTINRARPAIGVDTYWRLDGRISRPSTIQVLFSPEYNGPHPRFTSSWTVSTDSPTIVWLPPHLWHVKKGYDVQFVPLAPPSSDGSMVDVAVRVIGMHKPPRVAQARSIQGSGGAVRLGTVRVTP